MRQQCRTANQKQRSFTYISLKDTVTKAACLILRDVQINCVCFCYINHIKWRVVRSYLMNANYEIIAEDMVKEDGKFYPIIKAVKREKRSMQLSECELWYGPFLLKDKNQVLYEFLQGEYNTFKNLQKELGRKVNETTDFNRKIRIENRLKEITNKINCITPLLEE